MNTILELLLADEFQDAWATYQALPSPDEEDTRWAAAALFQRRDFTHARDLLLSAVGAGHAPARIDLATVFRHLGRLRHASEQLRNLDVETLDPDDRVLYYREEGAIYFTEGRMQAAIDVLERAWIASFALPSRPSLRVGVAHLLALALHTQGHSASALQYLATALNEAKSVSREAYLHSIAGLLNMYLGRFGEAEAEYQAAVNLADDVPALLPVLTYNRGLLARVTNRIDEALALLEESTRLAEEVGENETACYALLAQCSIHTAHCRDGPARAALERAKTLTMPGKAQLLIQLREGALLTNQGESSGVTLLQQATAGFQKLGLPREAAWGYLRLAHACLLLDQPDHVNEYLTRAVDGRHALGNAAPLFGEMSEMRELLDHLAALDVSSYAKCLYEEYRACVSERPRKLTLLTLPSPRMLIDGEPLVSGFRHAVPILAYLLIKGPVTMKRLTADVLPDMPPDRARNYVHQVRYRIQQLVPGVSIPFQADRRYSLHSSSTTIECDYLLAYTRASQGLEGALQALNLHQGPFLADLDDEWVEQAREDLRTALLTAGWHELTKPKAHTNPRSIELAWRLLAVDPVNIDLGQTLLELHQELESERATRYVLDRLQKHYVRVLDEIPAELS